MISHNAASLHNHVIYGGGFNAESNERAIRCMHGYESSENMTDWTYWIERRITGSQLME